MLSLLEKDLFNKFWEVYPDKMKKNLGQAEIEWGLLRVNPDLCLQIVKAVKVAKLSDDWNMEGGKFIPMPNNFLKGKRWLEWQGYDISRMQKTQNRPEYYKSTNEDIKRNPELAKDSIEFFDMIYRFNPASKEKYEFELNWANSMCLKYPHLASEYKKHARDAKMKISEIQSKEDDILDCPY